MIGRTNAGISGGSSSTWYAYIQVSTDANAIITAVNPAGNSYTKTADSTGSAIFIVAYPGTYTISETGATSKTVVVADYGVAYPVSIYIPTFNGILIADGVEMVSFTTVGKEFSNMGGVAPVVVGSIIYYDAGQSYNVRYATETYNKSGMYLTTNSYDLSQFSSYEFIGTTQSGTNYFCIIEENSLDVVDQGTISYTNITRLSRSINVDRTKRYRFGFWMIANTSSGDIGTIYVNSFKLE